MRTARFVVFAFPTTVTSARSTLATKWRGPLAEGWVGLQLVVI